MSACFKVAAIRSLAKAVHQCPELRFTATQQCILKDFVAGSYQL